MKEVFSQFMVKNIKLMMRRRGKKMKLCWDLCWWPCQHLFTTLILISSRGNMKRWDNLTESTQIWLQIKKTWRQRWHGKVEDLENEMIYFFPCHRKVSQASREGFFREKILQRKMVWKASWRKGTGSLVMKEILLVTADWVDVKTVKACWPLGPDNQDGIEKFQPLLLNQTIFLSECNPLLLHILN